VSRGDSDLTHQMGTSPGQFFGGLLLLLIAGTMLAPRLLAQVVHWLLEHSVLVPASQAVLTIPSTHAGLDGRRLVVLIAIIVALLLMVRASRRPEAKS
jgi:hypothetical protein